MKPPARPSTDSERRGRMSEAKTLPVPQGFKNPGPTDRLRGVEENTAKRKPNPNAPQHGTPGRHDGSKPSPAHVEAQPYRTRSQ